MKAMIKALQLNHLTDQEDKELTCLRFVKSNHGLNTFAILLYLGPDTFDCCFQLSDSSSLEWGVDFSAFIDTTLATISIALHIYLLFCGMWHTDHIAVITILWALQHFFCICSLPDTLAMAQNCFKALSFWNASYWLLTFLMSCQSLIFWGLTLCQLHKGSGNHLLVKAQVG